MVHSRRIQRQPEKKLIPVFFKVAGVIDIIKRKIRYHVLKNAPDGGILSSYPVTVRYLYGCTVPVPIYFWSHLRSFLVPIDMYRKWNHKTREPTRKAIHQSHGHKCAFWKEVSMGLPRCETVLDPEPCWFRKSRSPKASVAGLEKVSTQLLVCNRPGIWKKKTSSRLQPTDPILLLVKVMRICDHWSTEP